MQEPHCRAPSDLAGWRATGLPVFSIIITSYNKGVFLKEAMESALAQNHDSFEVIIIDDGSADGSWDLIQTYAKRHSNLLAARHRNGRNLGVCASRRLGLELCRGLFSLYLDGDDLLRPSRLKHDEETVALYPQCTSIVSRSRYFHHDIASGTRELCFDDEMIDNIATLSDHLYEELEFFLACFYDYENQEAVFKGIPLIGAVTTRRDLAGAVGWQEDYTCAEDIRYFAEVLAHGAVYYSSCCLHEYRLTTQGAWFQARQRGDEEFWQRAALRFIRLLALRQEPYALERAHLRLTAKQNPLTTCLATPTSDNESLITKIPPELLFPNGEHSHGSPLDRYFIDRFLSRHSTDIRCRVLEFGGGDYCRKFGTDDIAALDRAVLVDRRFHAPMLSAGSYDCVLMIHTLRFLVSPVEVLHKLRRMLKPGGVLLCTCPAIAPVDTLVDHRDACYWSLYVSTARLLFEEAGFHPEDLLIESWGNLRVTTAFLWGLTQENLTDADFHPQDPKFPLVTSIRASKAF